MERERNRAHYKTWRNVGLLMGKYNLFDVMDPLKLSQRSATKDRNGNSHVATETQRGTWSKDQKDQKPPFKWCSGKYGFARRHPGQEGTKSTIWIDHLVALGCQGASHEHNGAASRGAECIALFGDQDSASKKPFQPRKRI